jgi:hypothetical protein
VAADVTALVEAPPENIDAPLKMMEWGEVFRPNGPGAFEAYGKIIGITNAVFYGEREVADGYAEAEQIANEVLAEAEKREQ